MKFYLDLVAVRILYLQSLACLLYSPPASLVPHLRASVIAELRSSKQKDEERNQSPSDETRRRGDVGEVKWGRPRRLQEQRRRETRCC
jgi:hypothetical protein